LDARRLQAGDELVVGEPVRAGAGVDAHDPEPAEGALLDLPVAVGVGERALDLLLRIPVVRALEPPVALGLLEHLAALLLGVDGTLDARHRLPPPQQLLDGPDVRRGDRQILTERPLPPRRLVLQIVTLPGV